VALSRNGGWPAISGHHGENDDKAPDLDAVLKPSWDNGAEVRSLPPPENQLHPTEELRSLDGQLSVFSVFGIEIELGYNNRNTGMQATKRRR